MLSFYSYTMNLITAPQSTVLKNRWFIHKVLNLEELSSLSSSPYCCWFIGIHSFQCNFINISWIMCISTSPSACSPGPPESYEHAHLSLTLLFASHFPLTGHKTPYSSSEDLHILPPPRTPPLHPIYTRHPTGHYNLTFLYSFMSQWLGKADIKQSTLCLVNWLPCAIVAEDLVRMGTWIQSQ